MNIRDVEVNKIYFLDDEYLPPEKEDFSDEDTSLSKVIIESKSDTGITFRWASWGLLREDDEYMSFEDCYFNFFLTPEEAVSSYIERNKRWARISNKRERKDFYSMYLSEAETYLKRLKKV